MILLLGYFLTIYDSVQYALMLHLEENTLLLTVWFCLGQACSLQKHP